MESHLPGTGKPLDLETPRLRKTYSSEPVVIHGIVGEEPQDVMSARVFGGGYRVHLFSFAAWKIGEQDVRTDKLVLSRAVPNSGDFVYRLKNYSYHCVRALFSDVATRAVILEGLESGQCPADLAAAAEALTAAVVVSHPWLGSLTLDRGLHLFSGNSTWNGSEVSVSLPATDQSIDPQALQLAEQVAKSESELGRRVTQFLLDSVVAELTEDATDVEVHESMFQLQGLHFSEIGGVEFWYNDAGLWGEHSLVVRLAPGGDLEFSVEG
jgi:hypothetical protein